MAKQKQPTPPNLNEIAGVDGDDIGAKFAGDLKLPGDELIGDRGGGDFLMYEKVLTDSQCKSTFEQRRLAIIAREWYVEPGGEAPLDVQAADDLRQQLQGINWDLTTYKMLMGRWHGYSVGELMLEADGTRIILGAVKVRKQRRFKFDKEGQLRLIKKSSPEGTVMPPNKFWVFRVAAEDDDDPYGRGLGYYNYWPVWFKRNGFRYWSLFLQRFGSPIPIAKIPPGQDNSLRTKVLGMLQAIISGGRLVVPNNIALEFLQAMTSSGGDFEKFSRYCDEQIAKINLSQTMTTDNGSSRSQAEVHEGVALMVIKSDADMLCESFNQGPATWLTEWNYPGAKPPKVWRRIVEVADLTAQANRDKLLFDMGFDLTEDYVTETYGAGFTKRKNPNQPEGNSTDNGNAAPEFAEPGAQVVGPGADAVEQAVSGDEWRKLLGPEVDAVEALTRDAGNLAELRDRLGEYAKRSPDAVVDSLARVMFAASIAGQVGAELEADEDHGHG
jgi:phage gp29-like protein